MDAYGHSVRGLGSDEENGWALPTDGIRLKSTGARHQCTPWGLRAHPISWAPRFRLGTRPRAAWIHIGPKQAKWRDDQTPASWPRCCVCVDLLGGGGGAEGGMLRMESLPFLVSVDDLSTAKTPACPPRLHKQRQALNTRAGKSLG